MADANWLLDTSILVDLARGETRARAWIDVLPDDARFISVITAAEMLAGCRNRSEERAMNRELDLYDIIWIDAAISQQALGLYRRFHLSQNTGFLDCLIAATALTHRLALATLNLKHFEAFPNLQVKRPY